jgi:serine/threonine-protein kinase
MARVALTPSGVTVDNRPDAHATTLVQAPRADVASDAHVTRALPIVRATPDPRDVGSLAAVPSLTRYEIGAMIGEGGMGQVFACLDHRIGREVALKRLRADKGDRPDLRERFLREVRVQGQLEHPSVVPVYDVGQDAEGATYLTMKRVRGETLEAVLDRLRGGAVDAGLLRRYSRHKLLTAFGSACLAVNYAHVSGVVHRDLKPSNIMLGYFGEVYVLDWGLAKIASEERRAPVSLRTPPPTPPPMVSDTPDTANATEHGSILGTPGFMAPEQCRGDVASIDERADVYALGAILFEILTLEPLHGIGSAEDLRERTLAGSDARASVRAPGRDIDPDLDAICVRATAVEPRARFATALELHDSVEAVLSGYRDVQRRRELGAAHASAAVSATTRALSPAAGHDLEATRAAMREISSAIALDPGNRDALRSLLRLFTRASSEVPREARRDLAKVHAHSQGVGSRTAALAYGSILLYAPLAMWMGVRDWALAGGYLLLWVAAAGGSLLAGRGSVGARRRAADVALVMSNIALAVGSAMVGPLLMIPAMAAVNTMSFVVSGDRRRRLLSIALGCLAIVLPLGLELAGAVPASMVFRDGGIFIRPRLLELPRAPTLVFLVAATIGAIVTAALVVARFRDALLKSEERLYFHTWLLRQLVPDEAYEDVVPGTSESLSSLPRSRSAGEVKTSERR